RRSSDLAATALSARLLLTPSPPRRCRLAVVVVFLAVLPHLDHLLPGDLLEEVLGDVRVVADDDQNRRRPIDPRARGRLELLEAADPLTGEGEECVLGLPPNDLRPRFPAGQALSRLQVFGDVLPQCEVARYRSPRVLRHGQPRDLDDPRLDRIDETEIAHKPREGRTFGVTAPRDVERC